MNPDPYYSSFFSNLAGCFFIGLFGNLRKSLIATGLTTGFCGCFTTFSGWNHQQAMTFFDSSLGSYKKGTSVVTWIVGLFSFVGALNCGKDLGQKLNELKAIDSSSKLLITIRIMFCLLVVLFSLLCGFFEKTRLIWFATLLGPFGALLRHFLGKKLNGWRDYPLGTFLANILGSIIYSVLFVVVRRHSNLTEEMDFSKNLKWTLGAVLTGFCSSLTTISSFVNDICKLPSVKRYVYIFCTIVVANGLSCVILAVDLAIA